jgi:lysozyme
VNRGLAVAAGAAVAGLVILWQRQPILQAVATDLDAQRAAPIPRKGSIADVVAVAGEANVRAMLRVIRFAEGTAGPEGYSLLFGGGRFDSFADHPRIVVARISNGKPIKSTAAGAYQFLESTWDMVRGALGLPDFSPRSQDLGAIELIRRRGALDAVRAGEAGRALELMRKEWASLPGAGYGQPEKRAADLLAEFKRQGGTLA